MKIMARARTPTSILFPIDIELIILSERLDRWNSEAYPTQGKSVAWEMKTVSQNPGSAGLQSVRKIASAKRCLKLNPSKKSKPW
jgi:hypothetical protein